MPSSANYKWYVVAMLWFCGFFNYADRQSIFSVFPLLQRELHLDNLQLGMLGSSFAIVYGICSPFAGNIVDRVSRKTAVLGGLWVWSAICMATGAALNFPQLLFFRAAEGLGETFYFPASMSLLSDYHGKTSRSRAMGFHQTSVYVGTVAGGAFGGLISQTWGWRWSFLVFGGLGLLLGLILAKLLKEPLRGQATSEDHQPIPASSPDLTTFERLRSVFSVPTAILCMAAFALNNFVAMVVLTWMPSFLFERFHLSLALAGFTATVYIQLASMAGAPLGGWLADSLRVRFPGGRLTAQLVGILGAAPFVVWCGQTLSIPALIAALTCWGFFKGIYDANIFASVFDVIRPEARGIAVGAMNCTGWMFGAGAAPIVIAHIAQKSNLGFAISVAAAALAGGAVLLGSAILFTVGPDVARISRQVES